MASLFEELAAAVEDDPGRPAYVFLDPAGPPTVLSTGEVHEEARRVLGSFGRTVRGELVVLAGAQTPDLVVAFWGALAGGAIPVVHAHPRPGEGTTAYLEKAAAFADAQGAGLLLVDDPEAAGPTRATVLPMAGRGPAADPVAVEGGDVAYVQFSSGTTGTPRGAELSHEEVRRHLRWLVGYYRLTADDTIVGWLPYSHDMGLVHELLLPIASDARSVMMRPSDWLRDLASLPRAVSEHRGTLSWMPNFAFKLCTDGIRDEDLVGVDLSSWRILGNGSELIEGPVLDAFTERFEAHGFDPSALLTGYGMSENVVVVSLGPIGGPVRRERIDISASIARGRAEPLAPDDPAGREVIGCGWPMAGSEVGILGPEGRLEPERGIGEVLVRGDSLFLGYRGRPQDTAAAMHDGWYRTGDLGYLADGQVHILERIDDVMVVGGRNVRPHDVEAVARRVLGDAGKVAVAFGVRDARLGTDRVVLACEVRDAAAATPALAQALRAAVLADADVALSQVRFVPRGWIPRTTSGKVARRAARDRHRSEPDPAP